MTVAGPASVHVVVPADIDDPELPSGGNAYDRRAGRELLASGWSVTELAVPGAWPQPGAGARTELATALASVPAGTTALVDGIVACGVPDVVAGAVGRIRVVVLVHLPLGDELGTTPTVAAELAARERETLHAAAAVVTTSRWAARRLMTRHGLPADRVHVAPPGVDPAPLAGGTDGMSRLLCLGSITPTKGQDLLVEALAEVSDTVWPRWRCDLTGPVRRHPGYVTSVRHTVEHAGLGDRVVITGPRRGPDLDVTFDRTDLLVLPSRVESYGMVVTEALARGIPVLAVDVGGVAEALGRTPDGRLPGVLVPPADVSALAGALRHWFGDPVARERIRDAARARRGRLDGWEVTCRCLVSTLVAPG